MCGLVGMVNKQRNGFSNEALTMFDQLLYLDVLRGEDSTGVFAVDHIGNVRIAKQVGDTSKFLPERGYKDVRQVAWQRGWAMVGHNRKATKGSITDANAHPFWVDEKLVLVHNGSMFGDHKHMKDVEVDSEAIAHTIADNEDLEQALQKVNAAYALIWYDVQKKSLNFIRNNLRPLSWAETPTAWFFASEGGMIEYVAARNNVNIISPEKKSWQFNSSTLQSWILKDDKSTDITKPRLLDINYRHPPFKHQPGTWQQPDHLNRAERAALACGYDQMWGGADGMEGLEDEVATRVIEMGPAKTQPTTGSLFIVPPTSATKREKVFNKPPVVAKNVPNWAASHTYKEWLDIKGFYPNQKRVRVECLDYKADDAGPGNVMMVGKTIDDRGLYCVFSVQQGLFKAITDEDAPKKATFYVEVDGTKWTRSPDDDTTNLDMDTWKGVVTLTGANAKLHFDGKRLTQ